ncbi:RNA polymerase sigma-70 RpoE type [mine drainage metagenome]|uniref:RNA polymerase sigma-70 RpoE type n=1 Tax=mine drainage metagenome TaxID=410659 RepID=T1D5M3_9ZZZZ
MDSLDESGNDGDRALVSKVQEGDRVAFDLLVRKYQHRILKFVTRYVHDANLALDITQESFMRAYRSIRSFRGESAFYTWLYRIAINVAKNHLSVNARRFEESLAMLEDPNGVDGIEALHSMETPEALLISDEVRQAVVNAIQDLAPDLRTAILLREVEGFSYEAIAQAMNCPVGTVRSRIFRAREAINARLEPLLSGSGG